MRSSSGSEQPICNRLMRYTHGSCDLAQRIPALVEKERRLLKLLASLPLPTTALVAQFSLRRWTKRELLRARKASGSATSMVVRSHVARPAQPDEVGAGMISRESTGLDVMHIEGTSILVGCLAADSTDLVAGTHQFFDCPPFGPVAQDLAAAPPWVSRAATKLGVVMSGRAALAAELVPVPQRVSWYETRGATTTTHDFLAGNGLAPPVVSPPAAPDSPPSGDFNAAAPSTLHNIWRVAAGYDSHEMWSNNHARG